MIIDCQKIGSINSLILNKIWDSVKIEYEVNKRANFLLKNNVRAKDKVIIAHGGGPEFFADLFSIWKIGACAVCLNPKITNSELENICNFIKPSAILISEMSQKYSIKEYQFLDLSDLEDDMSNQSEPIKINNNSDALILFTSGTTGTPKGVVHTYASLKSRIKYNLKNIPTDDLQNSLCLLPMHFGHGLIGNCLTPLAAGKNLFISNGSDIKNISLLGSIIDTNKISFLSSVPSLWKLIIKLSSQPKLKTLKRIHVGSAPLSKILWNDIIDWSSIKRVLNMYGITETANWISGASSEDYDPVDGLVGKMWGGKAYVLDENRNIILTGKGVILLDIPSLMKGYYQLKDLTDRCIHDGLFNTGDIGTIDNEGTIIITGREKFEINRAGLKINPEELDILIEKHELVDEACAFSIEDDVFGEVPGVAVKLNGSISVAELKNWCMDKITIEKVPSKWFFVEEIPKTDRGKVDRLNIAAMCLAKS